MLPHLSVDIEAEARRVHHHHGQQALQRKGSESVHSEHQSVALHVETGCYLISDETGKHHEDSSAETQWENLVMFIESMVFCTFLSRNKSKHVFCCTFEFKYPV